MSRGFNFAIVFSIVCFELSFLFKSEAPRIVSTYNLFIIIMVVALLIAKVRFEAKLETAEEAKIKENNEVKMMSLVTYFLTPLVLAMPLVSLYLLKLSHEGLMFENKFFLFITVVHLINMLTIIFNLLNLSKIIKNSTEEVESAEENKLKEMNSLIEKTKFTYTRDSEIYLKREEAIIALRNAFDKMEEHKEYQSIEKKNLFKTEYEQGIARKIYILENMSEEQREKEEFKVLNHIEEIIEKANKFTEKIEE